MAAWFTLLKPVIPTLSKVIAEVVLHQFTKPKSKGEVPPDVMSTQINELQGASAANAEAIKVVAQQLESTVKAIEEGARSAELKNEEIVRQVNLLRRTVIVSAMLAFASILFAVSVLLFR